MNEFSDNHLMLIVLDAYLMPIEKWSNTLKQIVGNLPTICLSAFDHFMNLAIKGLTTNDGRVSCLKPRKGKESLGKAEFVKHENYF